jgi:protein-S-isoprenylcysteine O-methyltransferase Ste14
MLMLLRHLLSIAALPFVVTVVIPIWVARRNNVTLSLATSLQYLLLQALGLGVLGIGIILFVTSLKRFATEGEGTLAPWDPPRKLVVRGPYRYVRNPMISGVIFMLLGEALILLSMPHLQWALVFLAINALYIPLLEEPQLKDRFGDEYLDYCRHVPRLLPRTRPWQPEI